jgi:hypothetical protein
MPALFHVSIPHISFMCVVFLYALFGSPTPDHPGVIEVLIGISLMFCVGAQGIKNTLFFKNTRSKINLSGQILVLYGICGPLIIALLNGHDVTLVLRDIIPFLFLCLPVFLAHNFQDKAGRDLAITAALLIGVCFAGRSILEGIDIAVRIISIKPAGELTYLANSPLILFTLLFLSGLILDKIRDNPFKHIALILAGVCAVIICILPLGMTLQRASLGYAVWAFVILLGLSFYASPKRGLWVILIFIIVIILFHESFTHVLYNIIHKTTLVGFNNRFEEWAAVWDRLSNSPLAVLFGAGWGATYHSPAVGGLEVNFTHSLLSSMLLKTGLVGCIFVLFYLGMIAKQMMIYTKQNPKFVLAGFGAFIIPVTLYASYKSLDFGLLLLLLRVYPRKD